MVNVTFSPVRLGRRIVKNNCQPNVYRTDVFQARFQNIARAATWLYGSSWEQRLWMIQRWYRLSLRRRRGGRVYMEVGPVADLSLRPFCAAFFTVLVKLFARQ